MFERLDANRDGFLSVEEWGRYVREPAQAPLDDDADGLISPEEWVHSFQEVNPSLWEDPGTVLAYNLQSIRMSRCLGLPEKALAQYWHLVAREPWHPELHLGLARGLERAGDAPGAVKAYRKAGELDPNSAEVLLGLAPLVAGEGKFEEADLQLRQGLELLDWGALLRDGELDAAEGLRYRRAVAASLLERLERAGAGEKLGGLVRDWAATLEARGGPGRARRDEADAVLEVERLLQRGELGAALVLARQLDSGPATDAWLAAVHSAVALRAGKRDEATAALGRARAAGAPAGALAALELTFELAPGGGATGQRRLDSLDPGRFQPWESREVGWALAARGEYARALPLFERAQRLHLDRSDAVLAQALCLEKTGNGKAAAALLERFPELQVTSAAMLRFEAGLALRLGHPDLAYFAASRAAALEPGEAVNWLLLVQVLEGTARRDEIPGVLDWALVAARMDALLRARLVAIRKVMQPWLLLPPRW